MNLIIGIIGIVCLAFTFIYSLVLFILDFKAYEKVEVTENKEDIKKRLYTFGFLMLLSIALIFVVVKWVL